MPLLTWELCVGVRRGNGTVQTTQLERTECGANQVTDLDGSSVSPNVTTEFSDGRLSEQEILGERNQCGIEK